MTLEVIRAALAWCAVMNIIVLILWWIFITLAHDWTYRMHSKWFKLSVETFDAFHYGGLGLFKICFLIFNLVPYFALRIVG